MAIVLAGTLSLGGLAWVPGASAGDGANVLLADHHQNDADDTGKNVRDRDDTALTPMDQGGSESDRMITAHIRKAVVNKDDLSTNAQNVKIITVDGVVTLRGPVKSAEEKAAIAAEAQKAPGVKGVDNQLEVERN